MDSRICLVLCTLIAGGTFCVSCQQPNAPASPAADSALTGDVETYAVKGIVQELKPDGRTVVIRHEKVPGYMPAMTMPFEVREKRELDGLAPGDEVTFLMRVTEKEGWIDQIRKTGKTGGVDAPARETFRQVRLVEPLEIGDPIPDYPLTNELGQAISLHQFKGKALALTFIFTRCPFPNFCPRMSDHFQQAGEKLSAMEDGPKNWQLLSISFDPEFDTPRTLRQYARRYQYDPEHWSFATGAMIEIDALTEQFGLLFPRNGVNFDHNLRTAVIDAAGRVQKVFAGNEWTSDELVAEMVKAASAEGRPAAGGSGP